MTTEPLVEDAGGCRRPCCSRRPGELRPPCSLNRELSWLEFAARVLALADESSVPLLERSKFLAIFSTGLDEFFQVRVAGL